MNVRSLGGGYQLNVGISPVRWTLGGQGPLISDWMKSCTQEYMIRAYTLGIGIRPVSEFSNRGPASTVGMRLKCLRDKVRTFGVETGPTG